MKHFSITLLVSGLLFTGVTMAEFKVINSLKCAEKIPDAKVIMAESERSQKHKKDEFDQIEREYKKLSEELQKDYSDMMAMQATASPESAKKARTKVEDTQRKLQEIQVKGSNLMQDAQNEMQMAQMKLQPYINEVIQSAVEVATKNPLIDAVWDEATRTFVYTKNSCDMNSDVIKVVEKKVEQKSTTVAKNKPATPAKVA